MSKWREKPVEIEAFQWMVDAVPWWWKEAEGITVNVQTGSAFIPTLKGTQEAKQWDWIIRDMNGEIYPCKPDIFEMRYEPAEGEKEPCV